MNKNKFPPKSQLYKYGYPLANKEMHSKKNTEDTTWTITSKEHYPSKKKLQLKTFVHERTKKLIISANAHENEDCILISASAHENEDCITIQKKKKIGDCMLIHT